MLVNVEILKQYGLKKVAKVKDLKDYYKNISGHEEKINYEVYFLHPEKTRLLKTFVGMTVLHPGKVNEEYRMTRGHSHETEEIYVFIKGKGKMILKKENEYHEYNVKSGDIVLVPSGFWHRVINTGEEELIFYTFKESSLVFREYLEREFQ